MARTTDEAVAAIIEVDEEIVLTPFIEAAAALVEEVCVPAGYDETRLELIERWLSAHFYTIRDPRVVQETVGPIQASYQNKVDLGLNVSHYGQMAMRLDTKGTLAQLEKRMRNGGHAPLMFWLGQDSDEVEDDE